MITLTRAYHPDRTTGILTLPDGAELPTLEQPWRDNQRNISCIPEGRYIVDRDMLGRHRWYTLRSVPGRDYIEIHPGSRVSHSQGCILMSVEDCQRLVDWFGNHSWLLEIRANEND